MGHASNMNSSQSVVQTESRLARYVAGLADPARAIGGPRFDAICFWGGPLIWLFVTEAWFSSALLMPKEAGHGFVAAIGYFAAILTYGHLVAVVPRAYFNREVFEQNRFRLTAVPVLLLVGLLISPIIMAIAGMLAILWDVHHSAMQNFGLGRIYDMKAGNDAQILRQTDLRLNWVLYVGPLAAGASLLTHANALVTDGKASFVEIAALPGVLEQQHYWISAVAVLAWFLTIGWSVLDYRRAIAAGYRLPPHKAALTVSTGLVSLIAWGFSSPLVAFISINIYHAIQYFALVWLKEGDRMAQRAKRAPASTLGLFLGLCGVIGVAYDTATTTNINWLIAPFVACSLLHFWYDSFVWSVRKKQV